ncbi:sugar ABC transporter substrate-binding protein [Thermoanaerobacter sp. A7A]|uniref:sugar ABC transporter substrate-binding protein n=1 Tax=Thermoanaerobacter sp. A7A TaxID=1350366 RepID=UPI000420A170|nr:sugar ABC transporter substrate-binding protein [Thermoanaerobacter sp. A7A]
MKKNFIVLVIVFSLIFLMLPACSSEKKSLQTNGTSQEVSDNNQQVEITVLALDLWSKSLEEVINAFEKENPSIKVKVVTQPFKQIFETIEVQMMSKAPGFDVFPVDTPLVTNYTIKGYLIPLDSYFDSNLKQSWIETALDGGTYNGKLMAAPMNTSSQVLYYNKDIFKERGIDFPPSDVKDRWTWEQLVEVAKKLTYDKKDGQRVYGFTFDQVGRPYQLIPLGQSLGAKVMSDDGLVSVGYTNSPEMVKAAKFYYDLFNTWKVSPKIGQEVTREYFATGKVAMFLGLTNALNVFKDKINLGISWHPYFAGGKVVTPTGSWYLGISSYSQKKEAAAKFIKFITTGKGAEIWFHSYKQLPVQKDLLESIEKNQKDDIESQVFKIAAYEATHTAVPRPKSPGYLEWENALYQAFEDIKNGTDPKTALDQAVEIIDKQLKKYESAVK